MTNRTLPSSNQPESSHPAHRAARDTAPAHDLGTLHCMVRIGLTEEGYVGVRLELP